MNKTQELRNWIMENVELGENAPRYVRNIAKRALSHPSEEILTKVSDPVRRKAATMIYGKTAAQQKAMAPKVKRSLSKIFKKASKENIKMGLRLFYRCFLDDVRTFFDENPNSEF